MGDQPGIGKIKVTLAIKGDSAVPELRANSVGDVAVGPNGFVGLLELQLGIPSRDISFTTRLIQYLGCIDQVDHAAAFYHDSYQADPFSVARTLLHALAKNVGNMRALFGVEYVYLRRKRRAVQIFIDPYDLRSKTFQRLHVQQP